MTEPCIYQMRSDSDHPGMWFIGEETSHHNVVKQSQFFPTKGEATRVLAWRDINSFFTGEDHALS